MPLTHVTWQHARNIKQTAPAPTPTAKPAMPVGLAAVVAEAKKKK